MDFGRSFTFQFEDPDVWRKIGLAALIMLIPIVGQLYLLGWGLEITRRIIRRETELLPETDFGTHLGNGFKLFVVQLIYAIPLLVIYIPMMIITALGGDSPDEMMTTVILFTSLCSTGLIILYSLLLAFVLPAATGILADKGSIGAALNFGEVFRLVRSNPGAYFMVLLGVLLAGVVAQLGIILCIIGVLFTAVYSATITSHLTGQAYRESVRL